MTATRRVVGIDPSLTSTGICTALGSSTIGRNVKKDAPDAERWDRLAFIRDQVTQWCAPVDNLKTGHDWAMEAPLVVLEGYSYASAHQAHQVGELGGIVRVALHEAGIPFAIVQPTSLKLFATGKGNAGKDDMKLAAQARLGVTFTGKGSGDECDATWLWCMGMIHLGSPFICDLPAKNLTALEKVEWP